MSTVRRIVRSMGLPPRDLTLLRIDIDEFKKQYLAGRSLKQVSKEFQLSFITTKNLIARLGLPVREETNIDAAVKELYLQGYSLRKIARELHTTPRTAGNIVRRLGLPERTNLTMPQISDEIPAPTLTDIEIKVPNDPIEDRLEPESDPIKPVKPTNNISFFSAPTLRELEKRAIREEVINATNNDKQRWRTKNGR